MNAQALRVMRLSARPAAECPQLRGPQVSTCATSQRPGRARAPGAQTAMTSASRHRSPRPGPRPLAGRGATRTQGRPSHPVLIHRGEAGPPPATSADVRPHARALMTHVGSTAPSCSTCSVSAPRSRSDGRRGRSRRGSGRSSCWHHATPVPSCGRRIAPCRVWPLDPGWRPALRPALGTVAVRRLLTRPPRRSPCRSSCSARAR